MTRSVIEEHRPASASKATSHSGFRLDKRITATHTSRGFVSLRQNLSFVTGAADRNQILVPPHVSVADFINLSNKKGSPQ